MKTPVVMFAFSRIFKLRSVYKGYQEESGRVENFLNKNFGAYIKNGEISRGQSKAMFVDWCN